jgi:syntaxin 5
LAESTSRFQQALELRTELLKKQQDTKRSILGVTSLSRRKVRVPHPAIAVSGPSTQLRDLGPGEQLFDFNEEEREHEAGGSVSVSVQVPPMFVQSELEEYNLASDRADAVETIERTLHEIAGMFSEIASQLSIHSEFIQRIDMNLDSAAANISSAQEQLLIFWNSIQNSRYLYLKIFGIVLFFIIVFMMLFA